jgi:hypothetical protein
MHTFPTGSFQNSTKKTAKEFPVRHKFITGKIREKRKPKKLKASELSDKWELTCRHKKAEYKLSVEKADKQHH